MRHLISRQSKFSGAALLLAASCIALGCSSSTSSHNASLSLQLTDAPGDVQHAVVVISEIYLQGGTSDSIVLMSTPDTTDLTTLAHATASLVRNVPVPKGVYSQLRFVITGAYIAVDNGHGGSDYYVTSSGAPALPMGVSATGTLHCPSCAQSGLKVNLPNNTIAISGQQTLLVDFNVGESFGHPDGGSGNWNMHPVMQATSVATSATITATFQAGTGVNLPIVGSDTVHFSDFSAILTPSSGTPDTVNFNGTTTTGVYAATFPYLVPGTYTVSILAPAAVTAFVASPTVPQTVTVGSGISDTTAFTLTNVTP